MFKPSFLAMLMVSGGLLALSACSQAPPPAPQVTDTRAADEAALRAATEKFKSAIGAHDLDTMLSFFTDDGWELAEDGPIARTAADRRTYWQQINALPIASDIVDVADRVEIARSGDIGVQYGEFRQILSDRQGNTRSVPQKFMTAWRKQADGSWRISASMSTVRNADTRPSAEIHSASLMGGRPRHKAQQ